MFPVGIVFVGVLYQENSPSMEVDGGIVRHYRDTQGLGRDSILHRRPDDGIIVCPISALRA